MRHHLRHHLALAVLYLLLGLLLACGGEDSALDDLPAADDPAAEIDAGERATEASEEALPDPEITLRLERGVDVSGHSGVVDWMQVEAAGHDFAFVKATEGIDLLDPAFDGHWQALAESELRRGAYHFYVTEDDPAVQAAFFIDNVDLAPGDLAPAVDVELIGHGTEPGLVDRLHVFLDILERHYGTKPILYTSARFWNRNLDDTFGDHPLWIAQYEVDAPDLPASWGNWVLWQHQGDAEIAGVEKGADLSRVNPDGVDPTRLLYLGGE